METAVKATKKKPKKKAIRRGLLQCVLITGVKSQKKFSPHFIKKHIQKELENVWIDDPGYILTGTTRDVENVVVSVCKQLKYRILQGPPNFQMFSGASAEQMRNADFVHTFKPSMILIFAKSDTLDSTLDALVSQARKRFIPCKILIG